MKKVSLKEGSPAFFIGKGLIIIAILVPSVLSFMLGYFVGKITTKENPEIKQLQESMRNNTIQPLEVQSQQQVYPQTSDPSLSTEPQTTGSRKEVTQEPPQTQNQTKIIYTVQVGAFKDSSDADTLAERLENKGYNTFTALSESRREGRLYKVWVGKFNTRQEAEIQSAKIKRTEGLHTFITVQKEESIRQP